MDGTRERWMKRKPRRGADPIEGQMELALNPGAFIPDRECFSFVSGLEEVAAEVAKLITTDSARAATLYETFLAGCYEKAEEFHDSSGYLGQFVGDLICQWIKARQASGADADETAIRLLAWMDNDPYALCYAVEKDAAKAFNEPGLAAFERRIRARFEAAAAAKARPGEPPIHDKEYLRRRGSEILRTIYLAQKNSAAYPSHANRTGITAQDCHALAAMLLARRKPEEALAWVERGIALDRENPHGRTSAGYDLTRLHRELLTRLGRGNEAIEAAWHEKAMDAAKGDDLRSHIELFIETKEMKRLAELVRGTTDQALEHLSHYATEPAAEKLEKAHPDLSARLWRAQGMRIVSAAKSEYYDAALSNFERARRCYVRAGLAAEWANTVCQIRVSHRRKAGFMSGFEALAARHGRASQPSFLERSKTRWGVRDGRDDS